MTSRLEAPTCPAGSVGRVRVGQVRPGFEAISCQVNTLGDVGVGVTFTP
jgi:hypothetical protein